MFILGAHPPGGMALAVVSFVTVEMAPPPMPVLAHLPMVSDVHVALVQTSPRVRRIGVATTAAGATLQLD